MTSHRNLDIITWNEDEETAPGGGRIRYTVEATAPNEGETCYFVHINEESVLHGIVQERDNVLLGEDDLGRMIQALNKARVSILAHKESGR